MSDDTVFAYGNERRAPDNYRAFFRSIVKIYASTQDVTISQRAEKLLVDRAIYHIVGLTSSSVERYNLLPTAVTEFPNTLSLLSRGAEALRSDGNRKDRNLSRIRKEDVEYTIEEFGEDCVFPWCSEEP